MISCFPNPMTGAICLGPNVLSLWGFDQAVGLQSLHCVQVTLPLGILLLNTLPEFNRMQEQ